MVRSCELCEESGPALAELLRSRSDCEDCSKVHWRKNQWTEFRSRAAEGLVRSTRSTGAGSTVSTVC